jgi:hypothetical protein
MYHAEFTVDLTGREGFALHGFSGLGGFALHRFSGLEGLYIAQI